MSDRSGENDRRMVDVINQRCGMAGYCKTIADHEVD
jgi:hypothetical protein